MLTQKEAYDTVFSALQAVSTIAIHFDLDQIDGLARFRQIVIENQEAFKIYNVTADVLGKCRNVCWDMFKTFRSYSTAPAMVQLLAPREVHEFYSYLKEALGEFRTICGLLQNVMTTTAVLSANATFLSDESYEEDYKKMKSEFEAYQNELISDLCEMFSKMPCYQGIITEEDIVRCVKELAKEAKAKV